MNSTGPMRQHGIPYSLGCRRLSSPENVADEISTSPCILDEILLHVSCPVRWDSDQVVLFDYATIAIAQEIVRSGRIEKVDIGFGYFYVSISGVAAWVIGTRD